MKKYAKSALQTTDNVINVTMYLHPIIYAGSKFLDDVPASVASAVFIDDNKKYHTTVNPDRIINGPLSDYGEELEPPISEEWEEFVEDCIWLIKETGFTVISSERSTDSKKSEYVLFFGVGDDPCGTLVYDLRISDHPFHATFPEEYKDKALEYLKMEKVLDGSATKAGIDFQIEKVTVGAVSNDTWDRAFNRLYNKLRQVNRQGNTIGQN